MNKMRIYEGGVSGTLVDPKKIHKIAQAHNSSNLLLDISIAEGRH